MNDVIKIHKDNLDMDTTRLSGLIDIWATMLVKPEYKIASIEFIAVNLMDYTERLYRHKQLFKSLKLHYPAESARLLKHAERIIKEEKELFHVVRNSFSTKNFMQELKSFTKGWVKLDQYEFEVEASELAHQYFLLEMVATCMDRLVKERIPKRIQKEIADYRKAFHDAVYKIVDLAEETRDIAEIMPGGIEMATFLDNAPDKVRDVIWIADYLERKGMK